MTTSSAYSFTRTGRTWGVLLLAAIAWLIVSLWAFRVAATQIAPHGIDATAVERKGQEPASLAAAKEAEALEMAEGASDAADQTRSASQQGVAEHRESVEQAKRVAEHGVESESAQLAQPNSQEAPIEEALIEQDELTLLKEQQLALAAKNHAAEQARLAARMAAEHQIRLRAQTESAMEVAELSLDFEPQEVRPAQEGQAAREAREAQAEREVVNARKAAAEVARRVAADAARVSAYEHLRREETGALVELSQRLQFQSRSEVPDKDTKRILDSVFEPLFLYAEMPVVISVSTNEYQAPADNARLSRDRARSIVAYLVSRGLQEERFDIQAGSDEGLPYGSHRVRVSVEEPIQ